MATAGSRRVISDVQSKVKAIAGKLTIAPGSSSNGQNYSFGPTSGGTLAGVNGIQPQSVDGNFLSMLAATGGTALTGTQLAGLLGTGFLG